MTSLVTGDLPTVDWVSMANGEDWLLRPVMEGLCSYERLEDTQLDLLDFAVMNEALDVRNENQHRFNQAVNRGNKR